MTLVDRLIAYGRGKPHPVGHISDYMERFQLLKYWRGKGCDVRLHHILRSDDDRALHDHPWAFVSIILRGFYTELRLTAPRIVTARTYTEGSILFRPARTYHRLILPRGPVWTLVIVGPKVQEWGFMVRGRKIHNEDYFLLYGQQQ